MTEKLVRAITYYDQMRLLIAPINKYLCFNGFTPQKCISCLSNIQWECSWLWMMFRSPGSLLSVDPSSPGVSDISSGLKIHLLSKLSTPYSPAALLTFQWWELVMRPHLDTWRVWDGKRLAEAVNDRAALFHSMERGLCPFGRQLAISVTINKHKLNRK